jgi:hypothetical protein
MLPIKVLERTVVIELLSQLPLFLRIEVSINKGQLMQRCQPSGPGLSLERNVENRHVGAKGGR